MSETGRAASGQTEFASLRLPGRGAFTAMNGKGAKTMSNCKILSNEAEFERWLIAALQYERQRLLGATVAETDPGYGSAESSTGPEHRLHVLPSSPFRS